MPYRDLFERLEPWRVDPPQGMGDPLSIRGIAGEVGGAVGDSSRMYCRMPEAFNIRVFPRHTSLVKDAITVDSREQPAFELPRRPDCHSSLAAPGAAQGAPRRRTNEGAQGDMQYEMCR